MEEECFLRYKYTASSRKKQAVCAKILVNGFFNYAGHFTFPNTYCP